MSGVVMFYASAAPAHRRAVGGRLVLSRHLAREASGQNRRVPNPVAGILPATRTPEGWVCEEKP